MKMMVVVTLVCNKLLQRMLTMPNLSMPLIWTLMEI